MFLSVFEMERLISVVLNGHSVYNFLEWQEMVICMARGKEPFHPNRPLALAVKS